MMNRIVLLTRRGEELFSGESVLSDPPPTLPRPEETVFPPVEQSDDEDNDEEPIPATLRSSVLVRAHEPVSRPIIIEDAEPASDDHRAA